MAEVGQHYQDKVGGAIAIAVLAEIVGGALIGYGAFEGGPGFTIGGALTIAAGGLYFLVAILTTVAAGVDYLKQIAENQSVAGPRKRNTSGPSIADNEAEHRRQLGRLVDG